MGFFLLGRARSDGELALISPDVFGSRQEALDALTALSSEPGFLHRDSEVFVADLDSATPVLLVASATPAPAPAVEPEAEAAAGDADVWEAPADEEGAEQVAAEEGSGLAGALKRAAGALESEGIVAPDSIGPEESSEVEAESAEAVEGERAEDEAEPESDEAEEASESGEPTAGSGTWPWAAAEAPPAIVSAEASEPEPEAVQAYVPDPFEEPSVDGGGLLQVGADDETVALGRPVVMGSYADEAAVAPVPEAEPAVAAEIEPAPEAQVEPEAIAEVEAEPETGPEREFEAEPETGPERQFEADIKPDFDVAPEIEIPVADPASLLDDSGLAGILADLEPIEDSPPLAEPQEVGSADALTCDDCVYENTCPNKEGLDPSKCGNFQWKAQ